MQPVASGPCCLQMIQKSACFKSLDWMKRFKKLPWGLARHDGHAQISRLLILWPYTALHTCSLNYGPLLVGLAVDAIKNINLF